MRNADPQDALIGRTLGGRYTILSFVAKGGGGSIYRARQVGLDREVAVKTLFAGHVGRKEMRIRFEREAALCAKLTDPNTVRVFDYGATEDGAVLYIVMEYLDGRNLFDVIKHEAPLDPLRVIHIVSQISGALAEAHELGIVHRDMKPGNVLLVDMREDPNFVKVVDFGLVKQLDTDNADLTQPGQVLGTPMYMAPEQIRGEPDIDARTDVYALGSMMYMMLTRKRHLPGNDLGSMVRAHIHHEVPTFAQIVPEMSIAPELEVVVRRCLAKDRDERFESCKELQAVLRSLEETLEGPAGFNISAALTTETHTQEFDLGLANISPLDNREEAIEPGGHSAVYWVGVLLVGLVIGMGGGSILLGTGAVGVLAVVAEQNRAEQEAFDAANRAIEQERVSSDLLSKEVEAAKEASKTPAKKAPAVAPVVAAPVVRKSVGDLAWDIEGRGDHEGALLAFRAILASDEGNPEALHGLGYVLKKLERHTEAAEPLCRARASGGMEIKREIDAMIGRNELRCQ